jgi:hypothetical protein
MRNLFAINKPIGLYKRLYKIETVLKQTTKTRMDITLWVDHGTIDEKKLITRKEIIQRLRARKKKIKQQLKTLESKFGKSKMKQLQALAIQELTLWG